MRPRKLLAGLLIRAAHCIYRPRVTERSASASEWFLMSEAMRRESRGWN